MSTLAGGRGQSLVEITAVLSVAAVLAVSVTVAFRAMSDTPHLSAVQATAANLVATINDRAGSDHATAHDVVFGPDAALFEGHPAGAPTAGGPAGPAPFPPTPGVPTGATSIRIVPTDSTLVVQDLLGEQAVVEAAGRTAYVLPLGQVTAAQDPPGSVGLRTVQSAARAVSAALNGRAASEKVWASDLIVSGPTPVTRSTLLAELPVALPVTVSVAVRGGAVLVLHDVRAPNQATAYVVLSDPDHPQNSFAYTPTPAPKAPKATPAGKHPA